jgi:uncharacterized membrane protein YgcG
MDTLINIYCYLFLSDNGFSASVFACFILLCPLAAYVNAHPRFLLICLFLLSPWLAIFFLWGNCSLAQRLEQEMIARQAAVPPVELPNLPERYSSVVDSTRSLSPEEIGKIETASSQLQNLNGKQFQIFITGTTNGLPIDLYARSVFKAWNLETLTKGGVALFVIAKDDHLVEILPGTTLRPILSPDKANQIVNGMVIPLFEVNDFKQGFYNGYLALLDILKGGRLPANVEKTVDKASIYTNLPETWHVSPFLMFNAWLAKAPGFEEHPVLRWWTLIFGVDFVLFFFLYFLGKALSLHYVNRGEIHKPPLRIYTLFFNYLTLIAILATALFLVFSLNKAFYLALACYCLLPLLMWFNPLEKYIGNNSFSGIPLGDCAVFSRISAPFQNACFFILMIPFCLLAPLAKLGTPSSSSSDGGFSSGFSGGGGGSGGGGASGSW